MDQLLMEIEPVLVLVPERMNVSYGAQSRRFCNTTKSVLNNSLKTVVTSESGVLSQPSRQGITPDAEIGLPIGQERPRNCKVKDTLRRRVAYLEAV